MFNLFRYDSHIMNLALKREGLMHAILAQLTFYLAESDVSCRLVDWVSASFN